MEQKGMLISAALSVGVGVGLGLASGQTMFKPNTYSSSSNALTPDKIENEMLRLVVDGRESNVTFDNFPYYLRYIIDSFSFYFPIFHHTCMRICLVSGTFVVITILIKISFSLTVFLITWLLYDIHLYSYYYSYKANHI